MKGDISVDFERILSDTLKFRGRTLAFLELTLAGGGQKCGRGRISEPPEERKGGVTLAILGDNCFYKKKKN